VDATEDFVAWENIATLTITNSAVSYPVNVPFSSNRFRFFRIRGASP
jgi:hypothetical protein